MNILTKKQTKLYTYVSRYANVYFYYNTLDDKYMYGIARQLDENTPYYTHKLTPQDTLDSLALKYYGRPDLFWLIADFNRIQDPFIDLSLLPEQKIKIPNISSVKTTFSLR